MPEPEPPFTSDEVRRAFQEFQVEFPHLGYGTFKAAYQASNTDGDLVLKILTDPIDDDVEDIDSTGLPARFARELQGMTTVESPHVVRLLRQPEIRHIGNKPYVWYAEPFYSGGTLESRLKRGESGYPLALDITLAMTRAVEAMWGADQIVHRDIKPGNIVFDGEGRPVLLDLGIAYFPDLTSLTDAMGPSPRTPRYAAPEQFEMRRTATIDFRTDLYLIGMVAFEALTGRHPFWEPDVDAGQYFARMENFSRRSLDGVDCPDEFKAVVTRLLAPRPSGRFRNVDLAMNALRRLG